ncbi:MAG: shikimate kinase [Roseovarius sp.]|nr:shikimate kinase [Roseovarius sp.]
MKRQCSWSLKKMIVLVGMMGSGKSAIGESLSSKLGVEFWDTDAEIEASANMTVAEIFERCGVNFFRARESETIERLMNAGVGVLSVGGGAPLLKRNRDIIGVKGISLWLKADVDLLWNRVRQKDTRPLLKTENPYDTLAKLHEERISIYSQADLVAEANADYSIEEMTQKVINTIVRESDVLVEIPCKS